MKFLIIFLVFLIAIVCILAESENQAERRTFDFFKKHHHKHRKEDHYGNYLDDADGSDGYHHGSGLNYGGHHPSVHVHVSGIHGYGDSGFHGGALGIHESDFHGGYLGESNFGDGGIGIHGHYGAVHYGGLHSGHYGGHYNSHHGGHHGGHISHFG